MFVDQYNVSQVPVCDIAESGTVGGIAESGTVGGVDESRLIGGALVFGSQVPLVVLMSHAFWSETITVL